jgi:hypothetical protein
MLYQQFVENLINPVHKYVAPSGEAVANALATTRKSINVFDAPYNADTTGVADAYAAIQTCIDANPNADIYFNIANGNATYKLSQELVLTDTTGRNFQGNLYGGGAKLRPTYTNLSNAADKDMAHVIAAYAQLVGAGGDVSGLKNNNRIDGFDIVPPTNGSGIHLTNSQTISLTNNKIVGGRYGLSFECCIDVYIKNNRIENQFNGRLGLIMSSDTTRVWYGSATPANTYWNDAFTIESNGFADNNVGALAHIVDMGSAAECTRIIENNYFFNAANNCAQFGYIGRNNIPNMQSNWFEQINYPVRILSSNAGEGGAGVNLPGVTAAQPNGTYNVGSFVDGFGLGGCAKYNFTAKAVIDYNVSGLVTVFEVGPNFAQSTSGFYLFSNQGGNQRIKDFGASNSYTGGGIYRSFTNDTWVGIGLGTDKGDNAPPGVPGEYVESKIAFAGALAMTNGVTRDITSIALTPGDWEIGAKIMYSVESLAPGGVLINLVGSITDVSGVLGPDESNVATPYYGAVSSFTGTFTQISAIDPVRKNSSNPVTYYLDGKADFGGPTTVKGFGIIWARRVR